MQKHEHVMDVMGAFGQKHAKTRARHGCHGFSLLAWLGHGALVGLECEREARKTKYIGI
jgi:hypothetical protein